MIKSVLNNNSFSKQDIKELLLSDKSDTALLFEKSFNQKKTHKGNKVYLRGLIELSNICSKNCYYCGIRRDNKRVSRYTISDKEVIEAARFAYNNNFGSVVIQSGEVQNEQNSKKIENLIKEIKKLSDGKLGITLSCGEQSEDTCKRWFDAGAHRYLLRIETSNHSLYKKLHPNDDMHSWEKRVKSIESLKKVGYLTGTGVMIGLPYQTIDDLADDLLFMKKKDIDMCGMGPYVEHFDTPLFNEKNSLLPVNRRFELSLKMIAILRLIKKDINIASTTALETIRETGRIDAISVGANIIMPNITPVSYQKKYRLYENKPLVNKGIEKLLLKFDKQLNPLGEEIAYGEWGDVR